MNLVSEHDDSATNLVSEHDDSAMTMQILNDVQKPMRWTIHVVDQQLV